MPRGARAALMCQNSLQVVVTAIIGAQICTPIRRYLTYLIIHCVFIIVHIEKSTYTHRQEMKSLRISLLLEPRPSYWSVEQKWGESELVSSVHMERMGECAKAYLLLLFLQLFVLHVLELGPHRHHFFLKLSSAQLIHVQHEGELHVLHAQTHSRARLRPPKSTNICSFLLN